MPVYDDFEPRKNGQVIIGSGNAAENSGVNTKRITPSYPELMLKGDGRPNKIISSRISKRVSPVDSQFNDSSPNNARLTGPSTSGRTPPGKPNHLLK